MNNNNSHNISGLSSYFPPLQTEITRNIHTCYSTKTCSYSNSNNTNKKVKYITYCPNEATLLNKGVTSISKNVHLLSGNNVNKNISLLNEDNTRHKSFMQLYSKAIKNKIHYHQIQHPFDLSSNNTHTHALTTNVDNIHKTYSPQISSMSTTLSMKHKHKKISSSSSSQMPQDKHEDSSDVQQHCKEFDLIFSNSINHLKKIKKNKQSNKEYIKNKYTNNAMNEITTTHNKLSYLSGVINYIYPKIVLFKTNEYSKNLLYKKHEKNNNNNNNVSNVQTCPSSLESYVHRFNPKKRKSQSIGTNICYVSSSPSQNMNKKHHKKHIIKLKRQ